MKKVLVSGSIAFDYLMKFEGFFKDFLLQKDLDSLNISFTGIDKKMHYGGCGANICYSFALFGGKNIQSILYGIVGKDFKQYGEKLTKDGVNCKFIGTNNDKFTASAYILTDNKENQITIYSPGPSEKHKSEEKLNYKEFDYAILSPDICDRTVRIAKKITDTHVPWFFDPGQMTHVFKLDDLKYLVKNALGIIVNSYELKLLYTRLKISEKNLKATVGILIETLGKDGIKIFGKNKKEVHINAVKPKKIIEPTGCGDAFRGGLLAGLSDGLKLKDACKIGVLTATYKIETQGTQNHKFNSREFCERYKKAFGEKRCPLMLIK